jgi:hypothetical protein
MSRTAEEERLRFEGDLDKWMKIIGAGITGYQPEAYAIMDLACEELVRSRSEIAKLREALDAISIYGSDTLSGRTDGPADKDWYRDGVREMRNRALSALPTHPQTTR